MRVLKVSLKRKHRHGSGDVSLIRVRMCALSMVALLSGTLVRVEAQPPLPYVSGMGMYSDIGNLICGKEGVAGDRWNPETIPFIGCLGLSSGRKAIGVISGHQFEIAVDDNGQYRCKRDGAEMKGCFGCMDEDAACLAMIDTLSSNSDGSVYFSISRKVVNNNYVSSQENWDEAQKPTSWMKRR